MILQALKEYYDRKAAAPDNEIAPEGFEKKQIPFIVVIKTDGEFVNLKSTREKAGGRFAAKSFLLPRSTTRTGSKSHEKTFLLWDHVGYLFGYPENDPKAPKQHQAWLKSLAQLPEELKRDEGVKAVLLFYEKNGVKKVKKHPSWPECVRMTPCNMTFSLAEDDLPIPCRPAVQDHARASVSRPSVPNKDEDDETKVFGYCLVAGEYGEIKRLHGRTPIDKDTKSLVAFQRNSGYDSFGKEQCYNAPVCISAEHAYTTGLNALLKSKGQRIQIGDATTVFWSAKPSSFENDAFFFFSEPPKDDPDRNTEAVRALYQAIWSGAYVVPDDDTRFYSLGLSPNAARIAVRFWHVDTVRDVGKRLKQHIEDLAIAHSARTEAALPMRRLLRSIAPQGNDENIPPNLAGEVMRAILEGTPYPVTLLQAAVRRNRAEQSKKNRRTGKPEPNVPYERAALIKACLNRSSRFHNPKHEKEITMCLDPANTNVGYRLGRLFAVLEKVQSEANPGINATIRDRFYGAASSTPVTVFGNLMRLSNHHLSKLEKEKSGLSVMRKKLIGEIMCRISDFPAHLDLADQGRFAIGYYHQNQNLWTKKTEKPS
ncbi:MAG: type I-C CRISPR-associated protein Cas8c/Csd1 [Deltaproteobacteria bacterium]|nr:type I-C CRISPR-associated protein Cas8c/Csd1 [Deltaproteobacteria bacterium]